MKVKVVLRKKKTLEVCVRIIFLVTVKDNFANKTKYSHTFSKIKLRAHIVTASFISFQE